MSLPSELQYKIISFSPNSQFRLVCRIWNQEIRDIHKKSVSVIENWYYNKRIQKIPNNSKDFIRYYVVYYPHHMFIAFPELIVLKFNINTEVLSVIPPLHNRQRSHVRDWLWNIPLELYEWIYSGDWNFL